MLITNDEYMIKVKKKKKRSEFNRLVTGQDGDPMQMKLMKLDESRNSSAKAQMRPVVLCS